MRYLVVSLMQMESRVVATGERGMRYEHLLGMGFQFCKKMLVMQMDMDSGEICTPFSMMHCI